LHLLEQARPQLFLPLVLRGRNEYDTALPLLSRARREDDQTAATLQQVPSLHDDTLTLTALFGGAKGSAWSGALWLWARSTPHLLLLLPPALNMASSSPQPAGMAPRDAEM